ncbi:FAD-linked oxidase C-terminal domain-containing protein [Microbacterium betulae]|uniref:FAD-linked oxidase C-terminal domain-containing protein n=1 Tax=Microbacterium betulae TaxID=2981139 RepID=A0AA97FI45_9MICO|nr:FAD-linked oxidase C-terminal domain-containing protein [Microbacterium sp. AB]WOF22715.1 FAD-linked oxidase C-terminal domain-containing protein [Microbacterium sp. AB]
MSILALLAAALRDDQIRTDPEALEAYSHDDAEWAPYRPPLAVVFAETLDDVVATVTAARDTATPIVPRGAGSGLSGGANGVDGSIVLSLERMTGITEVNVDERYAIAQAGVVNDVLRQHVAQHGLWYPPDPASQSIATIGGNVATNAGGICCVKYGVTTDYVIGLTVVLADGRVARLGRTTAKGVTGYDLTSLVVGSEGTLAIVVDATLSLLPLAGREERAIVGYFDDLVAAGRAVAAVASDGIVPSALELIDRTCIDAVNAWQDLGIPSTASAMLMAKVDETGETGQRLAARVAACFEAAGATGVERADDPDEVDRLILARRLAYPSLERLGPVLTEDICVPRTRVPEMLARIEGIAATWDVTIANIAHAGDGNLHPLIIVPDGDDAAKERAKRAFDEIVDGCRDLGGTVTGEHGVGLLKLPGARAEQGETVQDMQRAIKRALDPQGILNPGKAIPA